MAIRKAAIGLILSAVWAAAAQFPVRHEHLTGGCRGELIVDESGVRFVGVKSHTFAWKYDEIQQLYLEPKKVRLLTYQDNKWKLGADRQFEFTGDLPAQELYRMWKDRLDQRFVAALPEMPEDDFAIPVKHLKRVSGSEGTLAFGADSIVYSTPAAGESRTWRYSDIAGVSSSGPFQLTITTFEKAKSHYGDRKGFNFELKQSLPEAKYNELWLAIERKSQRLQ